MYFEFLVQCLIPGGFLVNVKIINITKTVPLDNNDGLIVTEYSVPGSVLGAFHGLPYLILIIVF